MFDETEAMRYTGTGNIELMEKGAVDRPMQKKIAVINDIAGYGRCAMTVLLPIISYMGVQACPLLTSVFSSNTAFPDFYKDDYTDRMEAYIMSSFVIGLPHSG